ncbi:DUF1800 domain-containing protein [Sediminicoccus rosea]|jgi:uncharacterized protein (DUF1800 family)|uniref:DUF1800 domain-containing protein n=1 Tax=Sediminicoccus rosea TaxID=1225128 RepID=A0ABZ0PMD1_9PROT|nr:DUF1800 domain-containing protein [Sediminicoccus rosea]WPB86894.1 DUF1800 domain-containing protein [Sediminicoccus rosea]
MTPAAAHAAIRFGLGARPGAPVPDDPRAWLLAQVRPLDAIEGPSLDDIRVILNETDRQGSARLRNSLAEADSRAWATRMLTTDAPFAERWCEFWSNHFAISRRGGILIGFSGHFHQTAIRSHVFGRFEDLLLAAYQHPAMLAYLDQSASIGPRSRAGQRRNRGLNENLARECLELHSVTPAAGYTQADVTALAQVLTGWSIGRGAGAGESAGAVFRPDAHEPGPKTVLGQEFPEGKEGGVLALRFLARHPSTHRALAQKLARHFIADDPPPAAVARLEAALRDTQGDLSAAARAVIAEPAAWQPLTKIRSAQDYAIAVLRGLGEPAQSAPALLTTLARLNQRLWTPPAPIGWPDEAGAWAAPEQLMRRVDWANELSARAELGQRLPLAQMVEAFLGPLARAETVTAARRAGSLQEAVLLVLASPEAQRR